MEDYQYRQLLTQSELFKPNRVPLHYLEIEVAPDGKNLDVFEDDLSSSAVLTRLKSSLFQSSLGGKSHPAERRAGKIYVIMTVCSDRGHRGLPFLPFPLKANEFQDIVETLRLPTTYLLVLRREAATFVKLPMPGAEHGYVFQSGGAASGSYSFSMALTHHPEKGDTYALIHGLEGEEANVLSDLLKHSGLLLVTPMLLPTLLIEHRLEAVSRYITILHDELSKMAEKTGVFSTSFTWMNGSQQISREAEFEELRKINISKATQDLTGISAQFSWATAHIEILLPMTKFCETVREEFDIEAWRKTVVYPEYVMATLESKHIHLRSWIHATLARCTYLSNRAQAQAQVLYSLIAQVDNALNYEMTKASKEIAEASRLDNMAMKAIAEDSKQVALAALRDSGRMRTIAAITMIFLPATFTATMFSTTFFNFQPSDGHAVVSGWVWLYWVVTITLSAVIFSGWYLDSKLQARKLEQVFRAREISLADQGPGASQVFA